MTVALSSHRTAARPSSSLALLARRTALAIFVWLAAWTPANAQPTGGGGAQRLDAIVALVNGDPIYQSEVDEQLYLFLLQSGMRPDTTEQKEMRKEILERLIEEKVIVQEAEKAGVEVSDAELDQQVQLAVENVKQRLGGEGAFRAELMKEGISEADLRERYRGEVRRQALANQLIRRQIQVDLEVSPVEAEQYFKAHKDDFPPRPPQYRVAVIQVPVEAEPAAKEAARRKAQAALDRIRNGESFARIAQEVSEDPGTRNSGGDLGFFGRGVLDPAFEAVAFNLKPGQTSEVFESSFGFHVVRVEEVDSTSSEVHARHILVVPEVKPDDPKRAEAKMKEAHRRAASGENFAALVKEYSGYTGPAGKDGDLGFVSADQFTAEIRSVLDTLSIGTVSPPLTSPQGFVLFKMLDKQASRPYELSEIKEDLPELVRRIKLKDQYDTWVAGLRRKSHIEYR
jgi:peptidyl-prolyl cis-trans isomerase SurA